MAGVSTAILLLIILAVAGAAYLYASESRPSVSSSSISASSSTSKHTTILFTGLPHAGKTALFSKIVFDHFIPSLPSLQQNEATVSSISYPDLKKPLKLHDLPGHPLLRVQELVPLLGTADGIILVLDATTLTGNGLRSAAESIYVTLTLLALLSARLPPSRSLPRLLIHLSKSDLLPALASISSASATTTPSTAVAASTPAVSDPSIQKRALFLARTQSALAREVEKRRSSSTSVATSVGARLESLEPVALSYNSTTASAAGAKSALRRVGDLFVSVWRSKLLQEGNEEAARMRKSGGIPREEMEMLALAAEEGASFLRDENGARGSMFSWEKISEEIEVWWSIGTSKDAAGDGQEGRAGLQTMWDWIELVQSRAQ